MYREKKTRLRIDLWIDPFRQNEEQEKVAMEAEKGKKEDGTGREKPRVLGASREKMIKATEH